MDLHAVSCFLILLTCTGVCFGQELILPERIDIESGKDVVITPLRIPDPKPVLFRWLFNGSIIINVYPGGNATSPPYFGRVSVNTTTLALELRSLTERDTGPYTLTADRDSVQFTGQTSLQVLVSNGGDSLSAGAIAGIVIGVLLGVAGIAGLIFYFVKGKKMPSSSTNKRNGATPNAQQQQQHEMHYADINHHSNHGQQGAPAIPRAQASQHNKTATSNPAAQTIYSDVRGI